jgi:hypothetical protein
VFAVGPHQSAAVVAKTQCAVKQAAVTLAPSSRPMPEPIDFNQIARYVIALVDSQYFAPEVYDHLDPKAIAALIGKVAKQLRLVWNARGMADLATILDLIGVDVDTPRKTDITRALKTLDR